MNTALRRGLLEMQMARKSAAFVVQPQQMGSLRVGFTLDRISAVLEEADGSYT